MSIGLYDADMMKYRVVPFNLDLMKLSSYYKKRGEIVILSPQFTPDRNTRFIYRKDYDDGEYPNLSEYKNVEYGGLAFTQNKYIPFDEKIESVIPDTGLYYKLKDFFIGNTYPNRKIFNNMMDGEHLRLSLDGKTIWKDYPSQFKNLPKATNLIFHDFNLNDIAGAANEITKILENARQDGKGTKIGVKFPISVNKDEDLLSWTTFTPNSDLFFLQYHGVIGKDAFLKFAESFRTRAQYKQFDYYVTSGSSSENDFVKNRLIEIYHQIIISRSYRVFFSLKYDDNFFFDKTWEKVLDLFNFYQHSMSNIRTEGFIRKIADDTMVDFAIKSVEFPPPGYSGDKFIPRSEMKRLFQFVKKTIPELYEEFYSCSYNSLGGVL